MRSYRSSEISASGPSELSTLATIWHTRKRTALSFAVARLRRKSRKDSVKCQPRPPCRDAGGEVDEERTTRSAEAALRMENGGEVAGETSARGGSDAPARRWGSLCEGVVPSGRRGETARRDDADRVARAGGLRSPLARRDGKIFHRRAGTGASAAGRGRRRRADCARAHLELEEHGGCSCKAPGGPPRLGPRGVSGSSV